jgi:hypothetical protein
VDGCGKSGGRKIENRQTRAKLLWKPDEGEKQRPLEKQEKKRTTEHRPPRARRPIEEMQTAHRKETKTEKGKRKRENGDPGALGN